jgi:DUF4097 and DUF4098 domain-containing protein YvlB
MRPSALSRRFSWPVALLVLSTTHLHSASQSQSLDPHGKLQIYCPGNIKVRGTSSGKLTYRTTSARIVFTHSGNLATLSAPDSDSLEVTAPRTLESLTVHTPGGDLDVADFDGSLVGQAAGRVSIGRIGGNVELRSAGGPTSLGSIGGLLRCFSGGGAITAESVHGDAIFQTAGGDIVVQKASGQVHAYTAGGGIHIVRAGGLVTANNSGGPIQVGSAPGVQCQSASGAIRLTNISGPMTATTLAGSIIATFLPGLPVLDSFLSTAAGDITVLIPSNLHVSIRAQNNSSADLRSIVSDFPGLRVKSLRSAVLAEGAINGGGPLLRIAGNGGSIYIRKK